MCYRLTIQARRQEIANEFLLGRQGYTLIGHTHSLFGHGSKQKLRDCVRFVFIMQRIRTRTFCAHARERQRDLKAIDRSDEVK